MKRASLFVLPAAAICLSVAPALVPARAIVINGATAANAAAPADDPGWANVGRIGSSSGVYLGDITVPGHGTGYWVLTAAHVGAGSIVLNGTSYSPVAGSAFQLRNGDNSLTDLELFQLSANPSLPTLTLAASAPTVGGTARLIGYGYTGAVAPTYWDLNAPNFPSSPPAWTWTQTASPSGLWAAGFDYASGSRGTERWGDNQVQIASQVFFDGAYSVQAFGTYAQPVSGSAQLAPGDSGGATFVKVGSQWELAGINLAIDSFSGQPSSTATFELVRDTPSDVYAGNGSYMADLSAYLTQIPEPGTTGVVAGGLCLFGAVASRWRKA